MAKAYIVLRPYYSYNDEGHYREGDSFEEYAVFATEVDALKQAREWDKEIANLEFSYDNKADLCVIREIEIG